MFYSNMVKNKQNAMKRKKMIGLLDWIYKKRVN
jgi:hypothetical protein